MHKGFYTLDMLISSLIVIFMLFYALKIISIASYDMYVSDYNIKMNKIFIASEYAVSYTSKTNWKKNINWIDYEKLDTENIRKQLLLNKLSISFVKAEGNCITRYVVFSDKKQIRKLYVCGD